MLIITNINRTARSDSFKFRYFPRYFRTGYGSRIDWLHWVFEFYPWWQGLAAYIMTPVFLIGVLMWLGSKFL